jgi:DnaK suppressor protein
MPKPAKPKKIVSKGVAVSSKSTAKPVPVKAKVPAPAPRVVETDAERPLNNGRPIKAMAPARREALHRMLMGKRQEIIREIESVLEQSLTEDQQRRLESARDSGDQAMMDLQRELGISLMEMRNRKRQLIDDALARLAEGTFGYCAECGVEISEKRLAAVPFAKLCVQCQSQQELLEKIERSEDRD